MTCLKHMTIKDDMDFRFRVCALNLLLINIFHDVVAHIESRCVIKARHVLLPCEFIRFCAGKIALTLKRSCNFSSAKIKRINTVARHVLLQNRQLTIIRTSVIVPLMHLYVSHLIFKRIKMRSFFCVDNIWRY